MAKPLLTNHVDQCRLKKGAKRQSAGTRHLLDLMVQCCQGSQGGTHIGGKKNCGFKLTITREKKGGSRGVIKTKKTVNMGGQKKKMGNLQCVWKRLGEK